jgi:hypothetical protein
MNNRWNVSVYPRNIKSGFGLNTSSYPLWFQPNLQFAPRVWYNGMDGFQLGLQWASNYFDQEELVQGGFWINSGWPQMHAQPGWKSHFQYWGGELSSQIRSFGRATYIIPSLLWEAG